MIPRSSLLANRNNSCHCNRGELQILRGRAQRRRPREHCVNTLAVGRIGCVELTAPQCKVSPPYIPRSRKYIHCMAPLPGGLTPFISTPAVKEKKLIYSFFFFFWILLCDSHSQVERLSVCFQYRFGLDYLLVSNTHPSKFQTAYIKVLYIASIWRNIQRTNWRCQYYILYLWIRHTTHRFGFTCLKIFILLIYSILVYTVSCHSQHDSFGHIDTCSVDCTRATRRKNCTGNMGCRTGQMTKMLHPCIVRGSV